MKSLLTIFSFFAFCCERNEASQITSRTVKTKYGEVKGTIFTHEKSNLPPNEVFLGIPYASPPVGNLRFMPPVSAASWKGTRIADFYKPVCPQKYPDITDLTETLKQIPLGRYKFLTRIIPSLVNQSEDCLYLNIYAPASGTRQSESIKHPVLVFIHGESFEWNSGNFYDPTVLSSFASLVIVTVNYRLGIFGFLNLNPELIGNLPTNFGLMDQIAALYWIKSNIESFGGDSENITIMGHGTGAACVNFLITSPALIPGYLFKKAILMSGSAYAPWAVVRNSYEITVQVSRVLQCFNESSSQVILKCLKAKSMDDILKSVNSTFSFNYNFSPSVDDVIIPQNLLQCDDFTHEESYQSYDMLYGSTIADAIHMISSNDVVLGFDELTKKEILKKFVIQYFSYHQNEIYATILNEYTSWDSVTHHPINLRDETLDALNDGMFVASVVRLGDLHSKVNPNSFMYIFDHQSKFLEYPQRLGCAHGEELPYVFGLPLLQTKDTESFHNFTQVEQTLSETVMSFWSNFIRNGNPSLVTPDTPFSRSNQDKHQIKSIRWDPYENTSKKYMSLGLKPKMKSHYKAHKLSFWINLIPLLNNPKEEGSPSSHHTLREETVVYNKTLRQQENLNSSLSKYFTPITLQAAIKHSSLPNNGISYTSNIRNEFTTAVNFPFAENSSIHEIVQQYFHSFGIILTLGFSLLFINVVVFIVVYCHRIKQKSITKKNVDTSDKGFSTMHASTLSEWNGSLTDVCIHTGVRTSGKRCSESHF